MMKLLGGLLHPSIVIPVYGFAGEHRAGTCSLLGNVTVSAYCWLSSLALVVFMGTADVDLNSSFLFAFSLVPRAPPTGGAGRYGDHSEVQ